MRFLEKFLKPVPVKLPENSGLENSVVLATPDSCLVKISLVKDVRDGDYKQVITTLESIKKTEIDAETLIPWSLDKVGYEVEEITITTKFKEMKNLEGGMMLNEQQLASFRKMEFAELNDITKLLEMREKADEGSKELMKLSSELVGKEWQIINYQGALNKGMRAVIVIKKKITEVMMVEESKENQITSIDLSDSPYLKAPANWKN